MTAGGTAAGLSLTTSPNFALIRLPMCTSSRAGAGQGSGGQGSDRDAGVLPDWMPVVDGRNPMESARRLAVVPEVMCCLQLRFRDPAGAFGRLLPFCRNLQYFKCFHFHTCINIFTPDPQT